MQKQDRIHLGIGAVAVPIALVGVTMIDEHPLVAMILFAIAIASFIWGVWPFVFRKRRKKSKPLEVIRQKPLPTINYEKLHTVSQQDKDLIGHMGMSMMDSHGHLDLTGMVSDRANGVALDDLMFKPCSICGVIRNQRSRKR